VHLLHGDVSDKTPIATYATVPDICHAAATGYFDELVSSSDDQPGSRLLSHGMSILAQRRETVRITILEW
jgi:hypothetical protein